MFLAETTVVLRLFIEGLREFIVINDEFFMFDAEVLVLACRAGLVNRCDFQLRFELFSVALCIGELS